MGLYTGTMAAGLDALTGASAAAAGDAQYAQSYAAAIGKIQAAEAAHVAQLNISAIKNDAILSDLQIQMQQEQAEAKVTVAAAAAGVQGGVVDQAKYETEASAARANAVNRKQSEQAIESQSAQVQAQQYTLLAEDPTPKSVNPLVAGISGTLGELSDTDITNFASLWSE